MNNTEYQRLYRARDPERYRETNRRASANHREAHPDKIAARKAVYRAVRRGKLVRDLCLVCSDDKVEGHHWGGYDPEFHLEVVWLCRTHHLQVHARGEVSA